MKILEFIKSVQATEKNTLISDIISVKKYISSANKIRIAKDVMDFSVEYDRGFIKFDSYKKHLAFIFASIESHTDLCFSDVWADKMQEYDALCENGLLNDVIDEFKEDYHASLKILNMMCKDMLADNSIEASVARLTTSITDNIDIFVGALKDQFKDLNIEEIIPNGLDLDKLQGLLNKIK